MGEDTKYTKQYVKEKREEDYSDQEILNFTGLGVFGALIFGPIIRTIHTAIQEGLDTEKGKSLADGDWQISIPLFMEAFSHAQNNGFLNTSEEEFTNVVIEKLREFMREKGYKLNRHKGLEEMVGRFTSAVFKKD